MFNRHVCTVCMYAESFRLGVSLWSFFLGERGGVSRWSFFGFGVCRVGEWVG